MVEKATDIELAVFLSKHIDNPCTTETPEGVKNIRGFYIRLALGLIDKMTDQFAIDFLKAKINQYQPEEK